MLDSQYELTMVLRGEVRREGGVNIKKVIHLNAHIHAHARQSRTLLTCQFLNKFLPLLNIYNRTFGVSITLEFPNMLPYSHAILETFFVNSTCQSKLHTQRQTLRTSALLFVELFEGLNRFRFTYINNE